MAPLTTEHLFTHDNRYLKQLLNVLVGWSNIYLRVHTLQTVYFICNRNALKKIITCCCCCFQCIVLSTFWTIFNSETAVQSLLNSLIKQPMSPLQNLEAKQALAKQFAEILHFTLKFDELKVSVIWWIIGSVFIAFALSLSNVLILLLRYFRSLWFSLHWVFISETCAT